MIIKDYDDIKELIGIPLLPVDALKHVSCSPDHCVVANGGRRAMKKLGFTLLGIHVFRTIIYFFVKERPLPLRGQLSESAADMVRIGDTHKRVGLLKEMKGLFPYTVWVHPPRDSISKAYLRSDDFKKKRKESYERRKHGTARPYRKPKPTTVRHGGGKAFTWD